MATWQIIIEDLQFEVPEGVKVKKYTPKYLVSNGWECFVKTKGSISCIAIQEHEGIKYKLMFKIFKNGEIAWILKKGENEAEIIKRLKLEKWPSDGVIVLPADFDNKDNLYSRKEAVRALLAESCFYTFL